MCDAYIMYQWCSACIGNLSRQHEYHTDQTALLLSQSQSCPIWLGWDQFGFGCVHVLQQSGVADGVYVMIAFPGIGHDSFGRLLLEWPRYPAKSDEVCNGREG